MGVVVMVVEAGPGRALRGLLERRESPLRVGKIARVQVLPDLVERLGERTVAALARLSALAALELAERRIGLLRTGQISGIE
jgi:hypothetical protein